MAGTPRSSTTVDLLAIRNVAPYRGRNSAPLVFILPANTLLDRLCLEAGRDPASIVSSIVLPVSYEQPAETRAAVAEAVDAGFGHVVLPLPSPYPDRVARWVADEIIRA